MLVNQVTGVCGSRMGWLLQMLLLAWGRMAQGCGREWCERIGGGRHTPSVLQSSEIVRQSGLPPVGLLKRWCFATRTLGAAS